MKELSNSLMIACVATGAAGAAVMTAGCHSGQSEKDKAKEDFREAWSHRTPPEDASHPKSVVVAQGPSPLVYQVNEPCTVHIVDTTTGAEITSAEVKRQGMVYLSEQTGAFVNGNRIVPGPFSPGHRYAISVDVGQEQSWSVQKKEAVPPPRLAPVTVVPSSQPNEH